MRVALNLTATENKAARVTVIKNISKWNDKNIVAVIIYLLVTLNIKCEK